MTAARLTLAGKSAGSGVWLGCGGRTVLVTCAHVKFDMLEATLLCPLLPVDPPGDRGMFDVAIYKCKEVPPETAAAQVTWDGLLFPWTGEAEGRVNVYGFGKAKTCRPKELSVRRSFDGDGLLQLPSHHTFDPGGGDSGAGVWHGEHLIGIFRHCIRDASDEHNAYGVIPLAWVMALCPELWAEASLLPEKRHSFFFPLKLGQERPHPASSGGVHGAGELHEFPRSVEDPKLLREAMVIHRWDDVIRQKRSGAFLLGGEPGGGKTSVSYEAAKTLGIPLMELRDQLSPALLKWWRDDPEMAARCFGAKGLWLDGLDEVSDKARLGWLNVAKRFKEGRMLGACFITCRTASIPTVLSEHFSEHKPWFLLGLTPQEKPAFLRKLCKELDKKDVDAWIAAWQALFARSPVLSRLSGSPLLLRLLASAYPPSKQEQISQLGFTTLSDIYLFMVVGLLEQRGESKLTSSERSQTLSFLKRLAESCCTNVESGEGVSATSGLLSLEKWPGKIQGFLNWFLALRNPLAHFVNKYLLLILGKILERRFLLQQEKDI